MFFISLGFLLLYDLAFLAILGAIVGVLMFTKRASFAIVRRNFVGYFTNPTGYVFLCIFMFLTSLAAFWPNEFFNSNLANLDQLNRYLPLVMLFFIPAITMSIWSEERRQGTDELLLTLPADDFDIVIGKYFAAGAIFTASLLFSQLANFITMSSLTMGDVDVGLFFTSYLGYWFVGMTMIAMGMVASFISANLTVSFVLGALFNAPLAFASYAEGVVPGKSLSLIVASSGLLAQFDDFGRGVISSASIVYFVLVSVVGLYICMVLIGRRHWTGGEDGNQVVWHYLARILALVVITVGTVVLFRSRDVIRLDATEGRVSSLSPSTIKLIRELSVDQPISVDAFISNNIPEQYSRKRYEVVSLLKEFKAEAARQNRTINLNLYTDIELFSEEARLAEESFGITPQVRMVRSQGALRRENVIFGAAFRRGLEKVVVPFFESGIPVEYELVRSISTVARDKRKKLGVVSTDARLMGGFSFSGMSPQQTPKHPLMTELEKQFDVSEVDLRAPIAVGEFDVLLAVQPSSLGPDQLPRLVEAVKAGVPTAIYEDPMPYGTQMPGTGEEKQAPGGGMFGGGGAPVPKGDIRELWKALDLQAIGTPGRGGFSPDLAWQDYNPYPKMRGMGANRMWIFAKEQAPGAKDALTSASPITDGLSEILLLWSGVVRAEKGSSLKHTPLIRTGTSSGTVPAADVRDSMESPDPEGVNRKLGKPTGELQTVAMAIEGKSGEEGKAPIKVVYVADSDILLPVFLQIRATPEQYVEINFRFDNVTFLLNTIDYLAGELDYIEVRKHQPVFSTLRVIEQIENDARADEEVTRASLKKKVDEEKRLAEEKRDEEIKKLRDELTELQRKGANAEYQGKFQRFQIMQDELERRVQIKVQKLSRDAELEISRVRRTADLKGDRRKYSIKWFAVLLPCLPPILVGILVFAQRRLRERETIAKVRLR
jgi:ABC-2 type transport system permease protein